ncbi:MAG: hypothetical protein ACXWZU_11665 [Actinomycetota bacterium]
MPEPEFRPELLLEVLARHGVHHVLIGGFAAVIHGSPYVTTDVDVVPDPSKANLRRLSAALTEMHARVWTATEPEGVPFEHDPASLSSVRIWNLVSDFGRLDVTFEPSGTAGFKDLSRDAVHLTILGAEVDVASLADVIRSKEAAGREKDRLVLPVLRRIQEETGREP